MADAAKALKVGDPKHDYRHWPAIRAMILANPAWVRDDAALLDTLALRAAAENVVEFAPAAVAKLSDARSAEASARAEVEATAHANFEAQMRAQSAVIDLLEAADASDLAAQVDAAARTRFDLAAGALAIEGTPPDGWSTLPRGFVDHLLGQGSVRFGPVIGADTLFGACAAEVKSAALVRLRLWGGRAGLLSFGAAEREHFTADMGGELVCFLARIVELAAERCAPR